jgi:hypothetical protein
LPRRSDEFDPGPALDDLLEDDAHLQPSEVRAEAEVGTAQPEGHVVVRRTVGAELVGALEVFLVIVGRGEPEHHLVVGLEVLAPQFDVAGEGAAKVHRYRRPAKHLLDQELAFLDAHRRDLGVEFGPFDEHLQAGRERVARRVVAGRDHQREEVLEGEVVEGVTLDCRLEQ